MEQLERAEIESYIHSNFGKYHFQTTGKKFNVKLPKVKDEQIVEQSRFWNYNTEHSCFENIQITYVRSGIVFYVSSVDNYEKEEHFPLGCVYARQLEPESIAVDFDYAYYEVIPACKHVKVTYKINSEL